MTGVHSGQTHRVEDPWGLPDCGFDTLTVPAPDRFVTRSYFTISLSLWTWTNSKQHMLLIPILEKKSCFRWKPMPGGILLFPRGFGNEWFLFLSNEQGGKKKESKMEVASWIIGAGRDLSDDWAQPANYRWGHLGPRDWMAPPRWGRSGESGGCCWK